MGCHEEVRRTAFKGKIVHFQKLILHLVEVRTKSLISLLCSLTNHSTPCAVVELKETSASLMGHATESPEEIEVPISTVKFAIGDYFISSLFLSLYESSDVLVTVFS